MAPPVGAGAVAGDKGWNVGKYSCELDGRDEGEGELLEVPDERGEGKTLGKRRSKSGGEVGSSLSSASYSFAGLGRTDACICARHTRVRPHATAMRQSSFSLSAGEYNAGDDEGGWTAARSRASRSFRSRLACLLASWRASSSSAVVLPRSSPISSGESDCSLLSPFPSFWPETCRDIRSCLLGRRCRP